MTPDESDRSDRSGAPDILAWTLGTFHACAVGLTLLLLVYPTGGLGALLGNLETVTGLLIFIALWATTVWTTRRALAGGDWLSAAPTERRRFFRQAVRWGGATGILFLAELGAILLARTLIVAPRTLDPNGVIGFGIFIASFGTLVAFVIGGLTGLVLAALDLAALALARAATASRRG
jgi:hypothetical protein